MGVTSHLEEHAAVRDANQKAQMSMTDCSDRQLADTSVSKFKNSNQSPSSIIKDVTFNSKASNEGCANTKV